jgi:hypothetical protein
MNNAQTATLLIFWSLLAAEYAEASMVHEQGCNVHAAGLDAPLPLHLDYSAEPILAPLILSTEGGQPILTEGGKAIPV